MSTLKTKLDNISIKIDEQDRDLLEQIPGIGEAKWKYYNSGSAKRGKTPSPKYFVCIKPGNNKTMTSYHLHREIAKRKFPGFNWSKGTYIHEGVERKIRIRYKDFDTTNLTRDNLVCTASAWDLYPPEKRKTMTRIYSKAIRKRYKRQKMKQNKQQHKLEFTATPRTNKHHFTPSNFDDVLTAKRNLYYRLLQSHPKKLSEKDLDMMYSLSQDKDIQKFLQKTFEEG